MKIIIAAAITIALAGPAYADDPPKYSGPMFANPNKAEPPMPYWGVTLDSQFKSMFLCQPRENNHPTGSTPTTLATRFTYGSDEVAIYRGSLEDALGSPQDAYWVYTSQEATCRGIANGSIPLVKPNK